ncbi:hypothetical protein TEA_004669 [Camellia sinensis var. sinensis]|uniref:GATA-type domain-containing protein n=1 Tax=Camellia sinensis var. sinensis TaxID=542762 RepID=A0A4S4DNI3_CAMSN|nr:hypothetical protein TEA_004669 [Camellia sinensis var. sinensis]
MGFVWVAFDPSRFALNQDQQLQLLYTAKPQLLYTAKPQSSSSSSLSNHVFTYSIQDQSTCHHREVQQLDYQQEANNFASHGGSYDHSALDVGGHENQSDHTGCSAKWMSSKMRLMRKMMMNPDRMGTQTPAYGHQMKFGDHQKKPSSPMETDHSTTNTSSNNSNNINPIRVCSDCNTTKTPLWRSGPRGPKSLCNACGIRQRKARRAMAAAAAATNGTILASTTSTVIKTKAQHKDKKSNNGHRAQFKKRSKLHTANPSHGRKKKLCFEDFLINLSKNLAFHQVFPQDEKEAAILLMAISCGFVHG